MISKLENEQIKVIGVYRSQDGDVRNLSMILRDLADSKKTVVIGGDMNLCALTQGNNLVTRSLVEMGFKQLVTEATHTDGRAIDHVYLRTSKNTRFDWTLEHMPKYYSDHDGIGLTVWKSFKN